MGQRRIDLPSGGLLFLCLVAAGCVGGPRVDTGYRGNGDAQILEFMRGNYMSSEAGVARYLMRHLENGLPPGQVIDQAYLLRRRAICVDGTPAVCTFNGLANEYFSGLPKDNAHKARRVTRIEARVLLLPTLRIDVKKEVSYPDDRQRQ